MSAPQCEVCGWKVSEGADLYRVNPKGVAGVWRCHAHMEEDPPADLKRVVDFLSLFPADVVAPKGWRWNPRTGALERISKRKE